MTGKTEFIYGATTAEKVAKIFGSQLNRPVLAADLSRPLDDLGLDSLEFIQVMMGCEEAFGVIVTDEVMSRFKTLDDVITFFKG